MQPHEFTAGLEVHQQLDTSKLFCNCPSHIRDDSPDVSVRRILRASAGESGEMDIAAKHEQHKEKYYVYQGYTDTTCLVELDEEPVSIVNPRALQVALQVAKLLNISVLDEVHVMRKTVVDGSNTSGFQRTALIGVNGTITVSGNKIRIEQLCLEEDSAKIVERKDSHDTYNLSRLGIPLLEITTGPDLHSPKQVKEVAAYLGMLLRSTEQVKRGLGTIRQDVNVSVPGGERVELKGAQDLENLGVLVENEAARQRALINLASIIPQQTYAIRDISSALKGTEAKRIGQSLLTPGVKAIGITLTNWKESLAIELQPGARLGKELAGYAKAHGFGGLVHSSENLTTYPFSEQEQTAIRETLGCSADDAWLFMVGPEQRLVTFLTHVLIPRLNQLSVGVPKEVRKAEADGTSTYLRPMPGSARMYPETDVRPVVPDTEHVQVPELLTDKKHRLEKQYGISADLAQQIAKEGYGGVFETWVATFSNVSPSTLAHFLATKEKEMKTRYNLNIDIVREGEVVLAALNEGRIASSSMEPILVELANKKPVDFNAYKPVDESEVKRILEQLVRDNPGARVGVLMGKAMRHFENKVDGKQVQALLRELGVQP